MTKRKPLKDHLRELRIQALLQQEDVAKALGYSCSQFVSNWERGVSHPPLKALAVLAKLYKVSPDDLYEAIERELIHDLRLSLKRRYRNAGNY